MKKTQTLFSALRHSNLGGALVGMLAAGLTLGTLTFFSLHSQVNANLELVARSIAYSTEAAVMFSDERTAKEILEQILTQEQLDVAVVTTNEQKILARIESQSHLHQGYFRQWVNRVIFPMDTVVPIMSANQHIGDVTIRGGGQIFSLFFIKTASAIVLSLLVTAVATLLFTRNAERRITSQLDLLSRNTLMRHSLRTQQDEYLQIAEFRQIDQQFRTLLAELDTKNAELVARQMSLEYTNASLDYRANHDELTDLANRAYFNKCLETAIFHAKGDNGQLAVLYIDSDHFKSINDQHGHAVGDMYLIQTAQSLRKAVRHTDLVARVGGDEFAVLLAPLDSPKVARRVAEKILRSPELNFVNDGKTFTFKLCVSIGIAVFPDVADNEEALLLAADHAMYVAKKGGGLRYHEASPSDNENLPEAQNPSTS